jgi:hypothetical protein
MRVASAKRDMMMDGRGRAKEEYREEYPEMKDR